MSGVSLLSAARKHDLHLVQQCVKNGVNVNYFQAEDEQENNLLINGVEFNGRMTALHLAAINGDDVMVSYLIEAGADIQQPTIDGWTALHYAAAQGHHQIVTILLFHGSDINKHLNDGDAALHVAAKDITAVLLNHGANIDLQDASQCTPLYAAVKSDVCEMVSLLLNYGATINLFNDYRQCSVFHVAMKTKKRKIKASILAMLLQHQHHETVKHILDQPDKHGYTVLDYAMMHINNNQQQQEVIIAMLLQAGASSSSSTRMKQGIKVS